MPAAWWIRRGTVEDGPFTVDQLKRMASNGNLDRNGRIRLGKTTQWVEPQRMDWLQEYFESTPQKVTSETVAPPVSPSDENATPWYVYAAIGMGAAVMLAVLVLILIGHQKNGNELSGSLTAANESIGNNRLEENGVSKVVGDQDKPPVMPGVGEGGTAKSGEEEGKAGLPGDSDPHPEGSATGPATVPAPVSDDKQADTGSTDSSEPVVSKSPSDAAVSDVAVPIEPVEVDLPVEPFIKVITRSDPAGTEQQASGLNEGTDADFFGISAEGNQFAYVVDVSSSMAGVKFEKARQELLESIDRLNRDQEFFIVFFNNASYPQPIDRLIRATRKNKALVRKWIMQAIPSGGTEPLDSIARAIEKRPEAIFVLSDGEFDWPVVTIVGTLNKQSPVPIHTIGFVVDSVTLKQLANQNQGTYRHVP